MSTWVLLRGLTRERRHWGNFPELLQHEFLHSRVIALDLPGNGEFNTVTSPLNVAEMASHCRNELARQGVLPPYRLVAMSLGGMVATAWAQQFPREIDVCVLINTSFAAFNPQYERLRPGAWPTLLRILFMRNPRNKERLIFSFTSRTGQPPPTLLDEWVGIRLSRPVGVGNTWRQLIAAVRFNAPTSAPVLTLLLASRGDELVNARCSTEIARRWNCAIAMHPTAGHDLPLDEGGWVARQIHAWLAAASPI